MIENTQSIAPGRLLQETSGSSHAAGNPSSGDPSTESESTVNSPSILMNLDEVEDCECSETALQTLKQVITCMPLKLLDGSALDETLLHLKTSISRSSDVSQCSPCMQESSFATLLLVIYEKLVVVFEELTDHFGGQHLRSEFQASVLKQNSLTGSREEWRRSIAPVVGGTQGYQIDTMEEHTVVLRAIISHQLYRLSTLVARLMGGSSRCQLESHVQGLDQRINKLKARFES